MATLILKQDDGTGIVEGQLEYSVSKKTIVVGDGTTQIFGAKIDSTNSGSMHLSGDITASNASFSGDVSISGNLFLGNNTSDNINALGVFTSDLKPGTQNSYNIGSSGNEWLTVYANSISASSFTGSFSGSIAGLGDISTLNNRLNSLEINSASQQTEINILSSFTGSINDFTQSQLTKDSTLQTYTSSVNNRLGDLETTSSLDSIRLSNIETYSASLKSIIDISGSGINSITTIQGDLIVNGTQSVINSTTIQLGDNIIELNGTSISNAGLLVTDSTSPNTLSGSLLWDSTNDYWKSGVKDNESKILVAGGDNIVSSSTQIIGILNELNQFSASQNLFTQSIESRFTTLSTLTSSVDIRLNNLETNSSSQDIQLDNLELYTSSQDVRNLKLALYTGSVETKINLLFGYTGSVEDRFNALSVVTSSLNQYTTSVSQSLFELYATSSDQESRIDYIEGIAFGGLDLNAQFEAIEIVTSSLLVFTASVSESIHNLNQFTSSISTEWDSITNKPEGIVSGSSQLTSSYDNRYVLSGSITQTTWENIASKPEGIVSSSAQVLGNTGILSSSTENFISFSSSIYTSFENLNDFTTSTDISVQNLNGFTSSIDTTIKNKLNVENVVSSSSQILGNSGLVSSSQQISDYNVFLEIEGDNVVSGSSQIILSDTTGYTSYSASIDTSINNLSQSVYDTNLIQTLGINRLVSLTGSYATTGSNTFVGTQTISASVYITGDLIVQGSSSLQEISASTVNIGLNRVYLNTSLPAIRYAGMSVYDSGSSGVSASILWDSQEDNFVFVHTDSGSATTDTSLLLFGPLSTGGLGSEVGLSGNYILKGENDGHGHHITSSAIYDDGSKVAVYSTLELTGSMGVSGTQTLNSFTVLQNVGQNLNFANDDAAAIGGVPLYGLYRNGNFIMIRLT